MSKKLFVGNLDWGTTQEELKDLFSQYGEVEEVIIISDRETGRAKGFGFVTFVNAEDADAAIDALHEQEFRGRNMVVNEARPPKPRY